MSETATCRSVLAPYCIGNGLDIGSGGDPIVPWAICIDRAESDGRRSHVGQHPTHLVGDASDLHWFKDGCLDWVYSSHCLEDAEDTQSWLSEWLRVLRFGGLLVLFLPDQAAYLAYCRDHNELPNQAHKHEGFSLTYVINCLVRVGVSHTALVSAQWPFPGNPYSFSLVVRKP